MDSQSADGRLQPTGAYSPPPPSHPHWHETERVVEKGLEWKEMPSERIAGVLRMVTELMNRNTRSPHWRHEREGRSVYASRSRTIPVSVREFGAGDFIRCGPFGSTPSNDSFPITMDRRLGNAAIEPDGNAYRKTQWTRPSRRTHHQWRPTAASEALL